MQSPKLNNCDCEICGEITNFKPDAIIQSCDECHDLFISEMSKVEFEEIYRGINIIVKGPSSND